MLDRETQTKGTGGDPRGVFYIGTARRNRPNSEMFEKLRLVDAERKRASLSQPQCLFSLPLRVQTVLSDSSHVRLKKKKKKEREKRVSVVSVRTGTLLPAVGVLGKRPLPGGTRR